jgi:GTPase Era involved in 16S rRNA processing
MQGLFVFIICLVGGKDAGKTTLLSQLINTSILEYNHVYAYKSADFLFLDFPGFNDDIAQHNADMFHICQMFINIVDNSTHSKVPQQYKDYFENVPTLWCLNKVDQLKYMDVMSIAKNHSSFKTNDESVREVWKWIYNKKPT